MPVYTWQLLRFLSYTSNNQLTTVTRSIFDSEAQIVTMKAAYLLALPILALAQEAKRGDAGAPPAGGEYISVRDSSLHRWPIAPKATSAPF